MSSDQTGGGGWVNPGEPPPPANPLPGQPPTGYPPPPAGYAPPYGWQPYGARAVPRPGVVPLRPLGVGELLDGGFTTIRRYPGPTLGFAAVVMLVVQVARLVATYLLLHGVTSDLNDSLRHGTDLVSNSAYLARSNALDGIMFVVTFFATLLVSGLMSVVVSEGVLGRPLHIAEAWQRTRPAIWRLVGVSLAVAGIAIGIAIVGLLPGIVVIVAGPTAAGVGLLVVGGLAAFVVDAYVLVSLQLASPVVVLEKAGVATALRRSRALVRGSWWRVFGIGLLAGIIATVVAGIIEVPFGIAGGSAALFTGNPGQAFGFTALLVTGIGGFLADTLVRPFSAGVITLLYVDRRMRSEGLDLTLAQAANPQPATT